MLRWIDRYFDSFGVLVIAGLIVIIVRAIQIEPYVDSALVIRNTVMQGDR